MQEACSYYGRSVEQCVTLHVRGKLYCTLSDIRKIQINNLVEMLLLSWKKMYS